MANHRVGGIIELRIDGATLSAKGNFTYNLGRTKREAAVGSDTAHGFKETPQACFIEGEVTDHPSMTRSSTWKARPVRWPAGPARPSATLSLAA